MTTEAGLRPRLFRVPHTYLRTANWQFLAFWEARKFNNLPVFKNLVKPDSGPGHQNFDAVKILGVQNNNTLHGLVAEAFNDVFAKYGKPEIAPAQTEHLE